MAGLSGVEEYLTNTPTKKLESAERHPCRCLFYYFEPGGDPAKSYNNKKVFTTVPELNADSSILASFI